MTKTIQSINAGLSSLLGITCSFLPQEILEFLTLEATATAVFLIKVLGAFYLGWAILNYMIRDITMGGIYGRPIIISNLAYYGTCTILLLKEVTRPIEIQPYLFIGIAVYCVMSISYYRVLRYNPAKSYEA